MADSQGLTIDVEWMSVKFLSSVKTSVLTNEHFRLFLDVTTPVEISDPFIPIDVPQDFESISRTLKLNFKQQLVPTTNYLLTTTGLLDSANRLLEDVNYYFTTGPVVTTAPTVPQPEPIFVLDQSLVPDILDDFTIAANPEFYIVSVDPSDPFIDNDFNNGRVTVKFSVTPSSAFVNSQYFKVQKKQISRQMTRWQNVEVHIAQDISLPLVYIDFPSLDATPVYMMTGHDYFETGYKYRIKVSKDVSV